MIVYPSQLVIIARDQTDSDGLPAANTHTAVLWKNGSATVVAVTRANPATGVYSFSFTIPANAAQHDVWSLRIVDGDGYAATVWEAVTGGSATITQGDINSIVAGVQSVSTGIIEAQDAAALYITIGDTWIQDIEALGDLTDKTIIFAIKSSIRDADSAAVVYIEETTGLTVLGGAATTAGWGSIEILDEALGDIRITLSSNATALLASGTYVDAVKVLESGDDRTLRQRGKTIVSAGVIRDIT